MEELAARSMNAALSHYLPIRRRGSFALPRIRMIKGKTDVFVLDSSRECLPGAHLSSQGPFAKRWSHPEKEQLLMENEAIFHMTRGACVGGLSDFFCIAVDLCVHAPDLDIGLDLDNASAGEGVIEGADEGGVEPCLQSVHFLTSRVTCA